MYSVGPLNHNNVISHVWMVTCLHSLSSCCVVEYMTSHHEQVVSRSSRHDHHLWSSTCRHQVMSCLCTTTHMWCIVCLVLWYYTSVEGYYTYMHAHDHSNVCSVTRDVQTMTCHDLGQYHDLEMVPSRNHHSVCHYSRHTWYVSSWPDHMWSHYTVLHGITRCTYV